MKKIVVGLVVFLLTAFLVACGNDKNEVSDTAGDTIEISEEEKVADDEIVATINGDDVKGTTYNLVYSQLKLHAVQMGDETDEEEIKEATMESIIDRQLLFQEAKVEGIEVTEENAKSEFDSIKKESEKELANLLAQYQITEAGFIEQLKFELTMNEFMAKAIEVSVTDEEVKVEYAQAKEESDMEAPPFEEVKDQIKRQLLAEKTQEELQSKIDAVREKAEIERKI